MNSGGFVLAVAGFLSLAIGSGLIYKGTILNGSLGALIVGASIPFFIFVFFALTTQAQQFYRSDNPQGQSNLVGFNCIDVPFNDLMKCSALGAGQLNFPSLLDINGFPNEGSLSSTLAESVSLPFGYCNYHWVIDWAATTFGTNGNPAFKIVGPGTNTGAGRITVISGSQFVSSNSGPATELDLYGTSAGAGSAGLNGGAVEFTINNCTTNPFTGINLSNMGWLANASESGITALRLYRCLTTYPGYNAGSPCAAAKTAINAGGAGWFGGFNPDFIVGANGVLHAQPSYLRFLGQVGENNVLNNLTKASYRVLPSQLSYASSRFIPAQYAGLVSCTNNGTSCTTSGGAGDQLAATLAGATLTDGLLVQGYMQATTSTRAPCMALNGGTCYPVLSEGGGAQSGFTASISDGGGICSVISTYSGVPGTCMIVTGTPSTALIVGGLVYAQGVLATISSQASGTTRLAGVYVISGVLQSTFNYSSAAVFMNGIGILNKNAYYTFTWDAALDVWEATSNGLQDNTPIEIMAALCNVLNANMWYNIPSFMTLGDNSIQTIDNVALGVLNPQLSLNLEFANEEWNSAYASYGYANLFGLGVMNISLTFDNDVYYALRTKQYFTEAGTATNPRVNGILAAQFYGAAGTADYNPRFLGQFLCGTTCSNAIYQANIGTDYNASPNRPADIASYVSGAPYTQGNLLLFTTNSGQSSYRSSFSQTPTNNFANLPTIADEWASGDTTDAFAAITTDLTGSSSQLLPTPLTLFTLNNPKATNTGGAGTEQFIGIGSFTGSTTGSSTALTVTGLPSYEKLYADPVNGTVVWENSEFSAFTTLISQQSGTPGGNGVYTMSAPATNISGTVQFSGSYLQNWEQVAKTVSNTTGRTIKFLPYEEAWQPTGPTIADCNAIPSGTLNSNPKRYCANVSGPAGEVLVSGYVVGDVLTYATDSGFSCTVGTIAPDGTPLTCSTIVGGTCAGSSTNVALVGGTGFNIAADLTCSGSAVTAVTFYSQLVIEMMYAYFQNSAFQTITTALYNEQLAYPSTIGVAQSDYSGGTPVGNPWPLFLGSIYGTRLENWYSFQAINHGGYLLNRDLNPTSNDNLPVYLNAAA